jgi:Spy/CpxP family protein refolding chaperone
MISLGNGYMKMNRRVVAMLIIVYALCCGVGTAAAQFRSRNYLMRETEWSQSGRPRQQQLPTGTRLNPNTGKKPNPNQPRPIDLLQPTPQELELVPHGVGRPAPLIRAFRQLNLSDDQKMRLRNLTRQIGNQIQVLNRLHRAQNDALEEAIYAQNFDPKLVEQRAADVANTQAELVKAQARIMGQIRQILTPEQAMRFRELLDEERKRLNDGPPQAQDPTRSDKDKLPPR